jgi:ureidoglycolate hydrolase
MSIKHQPLSVQNITPKSFQPYGQVIFPIADDKPFDQDDAQLFLEGIQRFYIMGLAKTGIEFQSLARHQKCTQCLGAVGGQEWFIAVAPASENKSDRLNLSQLAAFRISGNCFIKLNLGTWHAGPLFMADNIDFYNLELYNTNTHDYEVYNLRKLHNMVFKLDI